MQVIMDKNMQKQNSGFTLLEVIITLIIVTLLATVAFPIYTQQITKIRRTEAKVALIQLAAEMAQYYAQHHTYATATIATNPKTDIAASSLSEHHLYQFRILSQSDNAFILEADPLPDSAQARNDLQCGALQINQLGEKTVVGPGDPKKCW